MARLRLNCHVTNLSASLEIFLPYQAVYYYLLDNPVSGPSFVPTVIAALHPSNKRNMSTSGSSISLQRKLMGTYQVLASQTKYVLGSL